MNKKTSICFSSSGWAVTYYLELAYFIQQNFYLDDTIFLSCSGGILPCLLLATNTDVKFIFSKLKPLAIQCNDNILGPSMNSFKIIDELFSFLPNNTLELINNRIKLSTTRLPWFKNELLDKFSTISELKDAILCSCYIPFFFPNKLATFRENYYIDGAFSDNHPSINNDTLIISAFFDKDIPALCKYKLINHVYYPGNEKELDQLFNIGFNIGYSYKYKILEKNFKVKNKIKYVKQFTLDEIDDFIVVSFDK